MAEDRRAHERAEIVGQLWGSVGIQRRVRDLGRGGALIEASAEAAEWLARGASERVQLVVGGDQGTAEVRRCRIVPAASDADRRQLVALQFLAVRPDLLRAIDAVVAAGPPLASVADDRRRTARVAVGGDVKCSVTWLSAVRLLDIGVGGALLMSARPVGRGERGELRVALATGPFTAQFDVRWIVPASQESEMGSFHLGVQFLDRGGATRAVLERFLRRAIG
jgi:PilZ domain-containing protein